MNAKTSHAVETVERFKIDGVDYDTYEKAIEARENKIEQFLRPILYAMDAKAQIAAIERILGSRETLRKLLDY